MAISTIQARRGMRKDFDPEKMLPGEWAVSTDPETENQVIWMCFRAGVVRRIGTYEDALEKGAQALAAAIESQKYALESKSYAVGEGGVRPNEATDNSKFYYEKAQDIVRGLSGTLLPMGTIEFSALEQQDKFPGYMFNISDPFITDSGFKEGVGHAYPAGTNVYRTVDGFWDCLAGTNVAGVKGNAETKYRTGNVNLTPDNIGLGKVANKSPDEILGEMNEEDVVNALGYTPMKKGDAGDESIGEFDRLGGNGLVLYPKEGVTSIPATGETIGQIVVTLPDTYVDGDNLVFDIFVGFEAHTVHRNIKYRIAGEMESNTQWLNGTATSIEFGVDYPVRLGYSQSKNKAAIAIGDADSSWNGVEVLITDYYCKGKDYATGSEGWSVSISATDFVENVANNWESNIALRSNMFDMLQNYTACSTGNLLKGTMFKETDFYGDGVKTERLWGWNSYINLYNEDPFGGRNAVGIYMDSKYASFNLHSENDNKPIKEVGKAYRFSVWMKATIDMPGVTIIINKSYGASIQVDVTTEWRLYEVKTSKITAISDNPQVQIYRQVEQSFFNNLIYFYCPKLEMIEEVTPGSIGALDSNTSIQFSEAATRTNLASGDSITTLFGKQRKWNADMKPVAFSGSYADLTGKPDIPTIPSSLPASDTTSNYSSTGTAPVNGTAVNKALQTLDVASKGGAGKYIQSISETDGKISAVEATMPTIPTSLPANGGGCR